MNGYESNPLLPLEDFLIQTTAKPALQVAAEKYVSFLQDEGLLTEAHVLTVQLVLDLARACGLSASKGRASGMALASKELREALELLPKPEATDEFSEMMKAMQAA